MSITNNKVTMPHKVLNNISIDHYGPVPLHLQFYFEILNLINEGLLKNGECMPTEKEFCEKFNVSRVLIRKTMGKLAQEGVIERIKGKGSFIRNDLEIMTLGNYGWVPLTTLIESAGKKAHAKILSLSYDPPPYKLKKLMNIDDTLKISVLKRAYYADGQICALNIYYLIKPIIWDLKKLGNGSLTNYLAAHHDIQIINAILRVGIDFADRDLSQIFNLPQKSPVLKIAGINRGKHGELISSDITYFLSDKTEVYLKVDKNTPFKWTKLF